MSRKKGLIKRELLLKFRENPRNILFAVYWNDLNIFFFKRNTLSPYKKCHANKKIIYTKMLLTKKKWRLDGNQVLTVINRKVWFILISPIIEGVLDITL